MRDVRDIVPARFGRSRGAAALMTALALAGLASTITAPDAHAALGGQANSIDTDRRVLRAKLSRTQMHSFAVHALTGEDGSVTREFTASDGTVFAVAWTGPVRPNLQQLFGAYYPRFQAVNSPSRRIRARRAMAVSDADFVVRTGGHPGAFWGYAILPGLRPADFDMSELTRR